MELNLFEPQVAAQIKERINKLQPNSKRLWGKMNVAQMLFHCKVAMGTGTDDTFIKAPFLLKLFAPVIKKKIMAKEPYKPSLPTAREFVITDAKDFDTEKNNLLEMIDKFIANQNSMEGKKHPAFGKFTKYEWGFSQGKHLDHHLKQFGA